MNSVNVVGVGAVNPEEAQFEALKNEEVNFLANQGGGYRQIYPRPGGNSSWNIDGGWRDHDREWDDHNATCKEREGYKDRCHEPPSRAVGSTSHGQDQESWSLPWSLDSSYATLCPKPPCLSHLHEGLHEPWSRPQAVVLSVKFEAVAKFLGGHSTMTKARPRVSFTSHGGDNDSWSHS
ncbi:hypothetical protein MTR67_007011 [Solanum verrucosum]|uniref:Uncharacterized protein n=1 Tax=Solanum verrucosum TaxID=315347 RepID=A0AAF0TCC6_SOLVR|nr:hypothetical protein MTR67_007011 [Solanum verrucosum]